MRLTTIEMMVYGKNIADFIHDIIEDDKYDVSIEWKDYYTQGTDPFACQTQSGFFLEEYNGMPCYLYTPIGRWKLMDRTTAKGKDWNKIKNLVHKKLKLELFTPRVRVSKFWIGYIGPVWRIISNEGVILPTPIIRDKDNLRNPSECREIFKKFSEQYPLLSK